MAGVCLEAGTYSRDTKDIRSLESLTFQIRVPRENV